MLWGLQLLSLPFPSCPEPCSHRCLLTHWLLTHSWKPQWLYHPDCGYCKVGRGVCHPLSPAAEGSREGCELHSGEATAAPLTSLAPAVTFPWGKQADGELPTGKELPGLCFAGTGKGEADDTGKLPVLWFLREPALHPNEWVSWPKTGGREQWERGRGLWRAVMQKCQN